MGALATSRERLRHRADSEHVQAVLRIGIVLFILLHTIWIARENPVTAPAVWGISVFSAVFSLVLLMRIVQFPQPSPVRRVLGAIHDNLAITFWLFNAGPMGALGLFVYPFVTVGNGFRYGVSYMAVSGAFGAAGIAVLLVSAPGWTSHGTIGTSVLISHVVVAAYTGMLLQRLRQV